MRCIKTLLALILLPSLVWADGVLTPAANPANETLYNFRDEIRLQDEFVSGSNGNGTIGQLGWLVSGGTTSNFAAHTNHFGIIRKDTSASSGTTSWQILNGSGSAIFPTYPLKVLYVFRINNSDANTTVRIGSGLNMNTSAPTDGFYFEKLDGDTNWFCVSRASSTQTRVDSGVAATASVWKTMQITSTSAGSLWTIDNVGVCGTITTNIPTAAIAPGFHIINSAAASKTMDVDYFELRISGLGR